MFTALVAYLAMTFKYGFQMSEQTNSMRALRPSPSRTKNRDVSADAIAGNSYLVAVHAISLPCSLTHLVAAQS
jgi:hypothetical protein